MDLALRQVKGQSLEDFFVADGYVEVFDFELHGGKIESGERIGKRRQALVVRSLGGGGLRRLDTGRADTPDRDFGAVDLTARRQDKGCFQGERILNSDIADVAAGFAVEVGVFFQIRAIAGRGPVQIHLPDESAVGKRFEAVVDGGERDPRDFFLHAHKNLGGGGVIPLGGEHLKYLPTLPGEAEFGSKRQAALSAGNGFGSIREILTGHLAA